MCLNYHQVDKEAAWERCGATRVQIRSGSSTSEYRKKRPMLVNPALESGMGTSTVLYSTVVRRSGWMRTATLDAPSIVEAVDAV